MNSKLIFTAIVLPIIAAAAAIAFAATGVFTPPPVAGSHDVLPAAERIEIAGAVGPESLAFDPSGGGPYTGVADGRILKWNGGDWVEFAVTSSQREACTLPYNPSMEHVCGRPLGLRFHPKTGDLYIADAYFGLQVVGPTGGTAKSLVTEVEGQRLRFTNDIDIDDENDVIYFTETSTVFYRRNFMLSVLTNDKTGRLMKYDISTKQASVLLRGLAFANGVSLSKDRVFVLVCETTARKILRVWVRGSNAGKQDTFAELQGFPDNIRRNPDGEFWVAYNSKTGLLAGGAPRATAVKLSDEGEILRVLEDVKLGENLRFISEVEEENGKLWIGSVLMPYIGIYTLE